jgi:cysteine-rich repeat protein
MVEDVELWDDGGADGGDGCSETCQVEYGLVIGVDVWCRYIWTYSGASVGSVCQTVWADSIKAGTEECDDGNTNNGDGWSSSCLVESDWECISTYGAASVWTKVEVIPTAVFQAAVGTAMIASVVASSMSWSSPSGLWQMMNLMQLLMFLVLLGVYLPIPIKDMITSSSFFSLSLPIPHLQSLYGIGHFLEFIDLESENSALSSLGAESGSTFVNVLSQLLMLLLIIILHLFTLTFRKCDPNRSNGWWSKWLKWTGKKIFDFFTFTAYIRLLLQSSQFMLMSSIAEFYAFKLQSASHIVSLCLAGAVLLLVVAFFIVSAKLWITRVRKWAYHEESKFDEFFSGLKKTKFATAYNLFILMRRAYLSLWIIWMKSTPLIVHLTGATLLQMLHSSLIILIRPFSQVKDNIAEVANELIFTTLMAGLIYFNKESAWNKTSISVYLYLLLFNRIGIWWCFPPSWFCSSQ